MQGIVSIAGATDPFLLQYVDEVIIGAPHSVTKQVLEKVYKVDIVVHGVTPVHPDIDESDPYRVNPLQQHFVK